MKRKDASSTESHPDHHKKARTSRRPNSHPHNPITSDSTLKANDEPTTSSSVPRANRQPQSKSPVYTDAIMAIKPEYVALIVDRKKNHEFRKYRLRPTTERLWLYESSPVCAIRYVACIQSPKEPGNVNDPSGIGNDEFDAGLKTSKFGYPVVGLLKMGEQLGKNQLKSEFGISNIQGYRYATEDLVKRYPVEELARIF
ncbi:hypothetical protein BC829DRAFT_486105 [Chytridium lagenaria]|nr:hypothetical protein BC829DRAFT_486105 [Chytridium lagenaria]